MEDRLRSLQIEYDKAILKLNELEKSYTQNKELYENEIITEDAFKSIENTLTDAKKSIESFNAVNGKITLSSA